MYYFNYKENLLFFLELIFKHTMKLAYYFLILLSSYLNLKDWLYLQLLKQFGFLLSS